MILLDFLLRNFNRYDLWAELSSHTWNMGTLHQILSNGYIVTQWEVLEVCVAPHVSTLQFNYCLLGLGWIEVNVLTKEVGWNGTAACFYSGSARFESWLEHSLSWLRYFMVFLHLGKCLVGILGHNCHLPCHLKFVCCHLVYLMLHTVELLTLSLNKCS
jgi:hypothetical protein